MFRPNQNHQQQSILESTQWMNPAIQQKLEKSWAPIFYRHVFCKIDEKPFSVLYGTTGKPNFPVNILMSLEYIKHMKVCNDLEILDAFYFDYLVNYAVGNRIIGELNLAERTLYYFRERIYQYCLENPGKEDLLFGQFIKLLHNFAKEAGISLEDQRTDTTLFMSNIKKAGRMSLAYDVLVKAVKAIPEKMRPESLSKVLEPTFKTDVLYRAKAQEGDSKLEVLLNLCKEALGILQSQPGMLKTDEVRIIRRFLSEQSITEEVSGKLIPKPNKDISSGSLQSAYDEDATYRRKGDVKQSGYALEISETCCKKNEFQLITDYTVKPNNTSDVEILEGRLNKISENTGCHNMYVDGGFHSEDIHRKAAENGIDIHLTNMSGTEPSKRMPVTAFDIDEITNLINKCPAGFFPTHANVKSSQTIAHFKHEACLNCEFREKCHSKAQTRDFVVRIPLKSVSASREREKMKADRKENTSMRAAIEGTNSSLKRAGQDKLNVRGIIKTTIVSGFKVTVQNIKRFTKYLQGGYKKKVLNGLTNGISAPNFS